MLPVILALAFILVLLFIVIAGRPDEFEVMRSTKVAALPAAVFPHVNNLRGWESWSPWAKLDPNARSIFEGPDEGVGAIMRWSGNKKIGEGSMTIIESRTNETVRFKLEFLRPFKAVSTAEFSFKPEVDQTVVTWCMTGKNNFPGKVFGLLVNCGDMVGRDFEKGLSSLKSVAEAAAKK